MTSERTAAEPLTVAYIAIGAREAIMEARNDPGSAQRMSAVLEYFDGELGVIESVIGDALELDRHGDKVGEELEGVWPYDVAEEYGRQAVRGMALGVLDRARLIRKVVWEASAKAGLHPSAPDAP